MLLLGGSSGMLEYIADSRNNVKVVMAKDERQKEALKTLKAMKKRTTTRNKQVKRSAKSLHKSFQDHSADAAEIDTIWAEHFADHDRYTSDMLDLRFELREHINREEWGAVFSEDKD